MHTWHWQTWNGLSYLTSSLLEEFSHGFFTQEFAPHPPEQLVNAIQPEAQVYRVKQVHGNTVLTPSEVQVFNPSDETESTFPEADGLVTEAANQSIWVCSADCVPALVADIKTGQVAAVHAGWRGTAQAILPRAIARLQHQGSQLVDLRVALGPAIAGEVYQVAAEVAVEVGTTILPKPPRIPQGEDPTHTLLETLRQLPDAPVMADPEPGRARLDVRRVNALQLIHQGLHPDQIAIAPYCTYQHADHFFSYRRDRQKKVQWSGIVSLAAHS